MKIAQYVETFSYVGMFITMNFASYICLWVLQDVSEDPVVMDNMDILHIVFFPSNLFSDFRF